MCLKLSDDGHSRSSPLENGLSLFHKCFGGFTMIFGLSTMDMVRRFDIEAILQITRLDRSIEIFLHITKSDDWPRSQPVRNLARLGFQLIGLTNPFDTGNCQIESRLLHIG